MSSEQSGEVMLSRSNCMIDRIIHFRRANGNNTKRETRRTLMCLLRLIQVAANANQAQITPHLHPRADSSRISTVTLLLHTLMYTK